MKCEIRTLAELAKIRYGKELKDAASEDSSDIPVYGTGGLMGYAKRALYDKPSVLIGRKGTIEKVRYVEDPFWTVDTLFYTEINTEIILPKYFFYLLNRVDLRRYDEGTTIPSLRTETLNRLKFKVPPLETQRKIASILSSLDDKIELNDKINANLEEQARAIFKSWFVDFEPFGGTMPEDWREYRLSEFLPVITGKKNANVSSAKGEYPFFSCAQDIAWTDDYSFDGSAILVAGNGDFNVKWYSGKFEAYQRTYVLIPYNPRFTSWLYYAVKHSLSDITSAARGSVINFITKGNLENFSFVAPRNLDSFEIIDTFASINKLIETRTRENLRLSTLRDALLPRLLSGELDVSKLTGGAGL